MEQRGRQPWVLAAVAAAGAAALVALGFVTLSGGDAAAQADPVHVHGIGVNPADGVLFLGTHTGAYRLEPDADRLERVGETTHDLMGFTVVGPDRFIASGHPDPREGLPPHLGLIESTDAAETWEPVSLLGEADFHVLRAHGERLYGYDATGDRLLASDDRGRTWDPRPAPGQVVDLAIDPSDPDRVLVAAVGGPQAGLFESPDAGRTWQRIHEAVGLLAWPATGALYVVTGSGEVGASADGGRTFTVRGSIGGEPVAVTAASAEELYVALHDGSVERSTDAGASWAVRGAA